MKTQKSLLCSFLASLLCFFTLSIFSGCQDDLVSEPNMTQIMGSRSSSNEEISAPTNLQATHGGYRSVTLTWKAATGASRYLIYEAESAFSSMRQVDETADSSTSITIKAKSGLSRYYCVRAINYKHETSDASSKVFGTTLAKPIITSIVNNNDGSSATVTWWMDNCTPKSYQDKVCYEVFCYKEENRELIQVGNSITVTGEINSVTFKGLSGSTTYKYKVNAYLSNNQSDKATESSDIIDSETAKRLIPDAAGNFNAVKGISTSGIQLSWTLPELVYCKDQNDYTKHPVYFALERKLKEEAESDFKIIASYIGSNIPSNINSAEKFASEAGSGRYYFDCLPESIFSSNITVEPELTENVETNPNYPRYIPGSKITFIDTVQIDNESVYTYRLISYVDDTSSVVTADTAITEDDGWLIGEATLNSTAHYFKSEENPDTFTSVSVSFDIDFKDYGLENTYNYILRGKRTPFDISTDKTNTVLDYPFTSLADISSFSMTFSDFEKQDGYWDYELFVLPANYTSTDDAYISTSTQNSIIVLSDATAKLEINNFTVEDGYAHKFILTWEMENIDKCNFSIKWRENGKDSDPVAITPVITGNTARFEHTGIPSGTVRTYTVIAYNGFKAEKSEKNPSYTLGVPKPEFAVDKIDYSSITVRWNEVQNGYSDDENTLKLPVSYKVSAKYHGQDTELCSEDEDSNGWYQISTDRGVVTCVINRPEGWNNPAVSGKAIDFSVTAVSNNRTEEGSEKASTAGTSSVCTLGPALLNTKIVSNSAKQISLTWNKVSGAKYYLVYRANFDDNTATSFANSTVYYVDASTSAAEEMNGGDTSNTVNIGSTETSFTLADKHYEGDTGEAAYSNFQQKLGWGLPFGYVVLPVTGKDDFNLSGFNATFANRTVDGKSESAKASYGAMIPVIGATYGYGLNVTAAKSESSKTISVTWDKPYPNKNTVPYVFRKTNGSDVWKLVYTGNGTDSIFSDDLKDSDKTLSYCYAVQYNTSLMDLNYINSYKKKLESTKDERYTDGITSEELNRGYLFYIDFSASYNGKKDTDGSYKKDKDYFSESVSHKLWDFEERARGPVISTTENAYTISAKNLNLKYNYINLANIKLDSEGNETFSLNTKDGAVNGDGGDTSLTQNGSSLILYPIQITNTGNGETSGLLKNLRSSKTFYKFSAQRNYSTTAGKSDTVTFESEVYAYRQITDTELAKTIGIIVADALVQSGIPNYYSADFIVRPEHDASSDCPGKPGKFTITHTSWADYSQWSFNGEKYKHVFPNGCSTVYATSYISDLTIWARSSEKKKGISSNTLYYLPPLDLTISHDSELDSYDCVVTFTAGKEGTSTSWNLSMVKKQNETTTPLFTAVQNNETEFKKYFPYNLGTKQETGSSASTNSLVTYNSNWWN